MTTARGASGTRCGRFIFIFTLGKYGQRVEIVPDWVERGEKFAPDDARLELETHDIVH
jgi:hypothetical protein